MQYRRVQLVADNLWSLQLYNCIVRICTRVRERYDYRLFPVPVPVPVGGLQYVGRRRS